MSVQKPIPNKNYPSGMKGKTRYFQKEKIKRICHQLNSPKRKEIIKKGILECQEGRKNMVRKPYSGKPLEVYKLYLMVETKL